MTLKRIVFLLRNVARPYRKWLLMVSFKEIFEPSDFLPQLARLVRCLVLCNDHVNTPISPASHHAAERVDQHLAQGRAQ